MRYNPAKIEAKWQKKWALGKTYEPSLKSAKKPYYNLMMFPYPSAEGLHVGNMYAFAGADIYGRFQRMQGRDVFEPIGLDGFGIHSENYALKIGKHPMKQAKVSEKNFYRQLQSIGNGFAWNERLETYDPEYYKWTQWLFVQMFKKGLAYRKKAKVNWCPSCQTVLADEQVISGECERCGSPVVKKDLEQWFFKITDYADRLLNNIKKLDWSEKVKIAQENWIGKSEGAELEFKIKNSELRIKVFTTRPDTLFGATYMVLAPEHPLIESLKSKVQNLKEVEDYRKSAAKKTEIERTAETKEKTGVELKGVKAINPVNQEEIPVWIADYVLASYGTGAIMAVPAHDERDFEFAQKFKLPIRQVIMPETPDLGNPPRPGKENTFRKVILGIVKNPRTGKYLVLRWKKQPWVTFITGGIEQGEDPVVAALREITEETGYKNVKLVRILGGPTKTEFFASHKDVNRLIHATSILFELENDERGEVASEEQDAYDIDWLSPEELSRIEMRHGEFDLIWKRVMTGMDAYVGEGVLINSGKFNDLKTEEAKKQITGFAGGKLKIQFRLRDWLISRQRYWGPPIPMIYCADCGWQPVPEKDLPVKLSLIKNFRPTGTGESPLASVKSFYETKCPQCKKKARRETDVSDTFLDSAWYFLRYPSVKEKRSAWNPAITKKWLPVDMYIGGAEHSVLHLLYSRFITMVMHDWKLLNFEEPFSTFRAHGLVVKDGAKMSKSKGNVVNPDEYIRAYGADALRTYLMFTSPLEDGADFRDSGISGITRFLHRVWRFYTEVKLAKNSSEGMERNVHRAIKKVTEDIQALRYNTAISALMTLLNAFEEHPEAVTAKDREAFLKLLAPFAPHITEELWALDKEKGSIHRALWPQYDEKLLYEAEFDLIVQVNGKVRGKVSLKRGTTKEEAVREARALESVKRHLPEHTKSVIFVPDRLVNFVF